MRVITGSARGMTLQAPRSAARPTMDRVRAAIFSKLGEAVTGARVLDLFAGSGGMGIEALSRGAAEAVFVDNDRQSIDCIRKNLSRTHLEGSVQCMDAFRFLELYGDAGFDLVFADPPYSKLAGDRDFAGELMADGGATKALRQLGTLILECSSIPEADHGLRLLGSRAYGSSSVAYFVKDS